MSKERSIVLLIIVAIFAVFCFAGAADAASCKDRDNDGYFNNEGCGTAVDCDDSDAAVNPAAAEVCDGIDNNCDGIADEDFDTDSDGYTTCGGDCNDSEPSVNPGAAEGPEGDATCDDGLDNDCDGLIDTAEDPGCAPFDCSMYGDRNSCNNDPSCMWEGGKNNGQCVPTPICTDTDGDGYGEGAACAGPDCDDTNAAINPGAAEICDDNIDNDCDGLIDDPDPDCAPVVCSQFTKKRDCTANQECVWEMGMCIPTPVCTDNDNDGYGVNGDPSCPNPGIDCNDDNSAINPGADDSICNNVDEDCSGVPDDGYVPIPTSCGVGVCAASGQLECQGGVEVDTCTPGPQDEPTDVTCDGLDGDCDGPIDEDYTATPTTCGVGECAGNTGQLECQSGSEVDTCDPLAGATPDTDCDGLDDDCDGTADDDYSTTPTTCGVGECSGNTGQLECQSGSEVDTCDPLAGATPDDSVCDGLDEDCDGLTDEEYATSPTTCGVGECSGNTGQLECQGGSEIDTCDPLAGATPDTDCDGLDDDCDGTADDNYSTTPTTCGVGQCSGNTGQLECQGGAEIDTCDPLAGAGTEGPEGDPTCSDTLDNDCDGDTDIVDQDCACIPTGSPDDNCDGIDDDCNGTADDAYVAPPTTCGVGECAGNTGLLECQGGTTVDTCDPLAGAAADDSVCNGLDDDCDGLTDEEYATSPTTCGVGECAGNTGQLECQAGAEVNTCDPLAGAAADDSVCNGLDDDCDGLTDEEYATSPTTCGVGECAGNTGQLECQGGAEVNTCDPLAGAAADDSVCNGLDDDCDGLTDEEYATSPTTCGVGECAGNTGQLECQGGAEVNTCDPLAGAGTEGPEGDPTCGDTLDNDCDGDTDVLDQDCACVPTGSPDDNCDGIDDDCNGTADDAYVAPPTTCGVGECAGNTGFLECQGGTTVDTCDPLAGAAADDSVCNGLDDDCDGLTDEEYATSPTTCGVGECAGNTGQLECQGGSEVDTCDPLAGAAADDSVCNGLDDDCDGLTDEEYATSPTTCGVGECAGNTGQLECQGGAEVNTCDPLAGALPDNNCDGLDNDCDGAADDDYVTTPTTCGVGECAGNAGQLECQGGSEVDTCDPLAGALPDNNCDGLDNDCDGAADDDYVITPTTCGVGECAGNAGQLECQGGSEVDTCDPLAGAAPNDALCNGLDDDCDGPVDEDFVISPTTCGIGECLGNMGQIECQGGSVVDTCDPLAGAAPDDSICNGLDDDCDGPIDEDYVTSTTNCGTGVCASTGLLECINGAEQDNCTPGSPTEDPEATCDDGLDNDCDGLTDAPDDPDCPVGGNTCITCHNGIPSGGSGYVTRDVVGGDFIQASRHIFGGTPTNWDCIVCHREGDETQAEAGVVANTALHQNAMVDMRNVDDLGDISLVWDKTIADDAMYTSMDIFCMRCHDSDSSRGAGLGGASGIAVATGDGGVTLSPTLDERMKPYNSSDGLDQGTGGGTKFLAGYERTAVNDAYGQYNPSNPSHHAVRGRAYSAHDADWGDNAWVDVTLKGSGLGLVSSGLYETAMLHCADCHTVDQAAHGGPNGFMLQAASIDDTCYRCHSDQVYQESGALAGSRWSHDSADSGNFFNTGNLALIGQYSGNPGSVCLNCHGGRIGEGGTFIGYDGYGGIHGLTSGVDTRSGEERYRFQGGAYMSHSPGSWTTTAGTNTCYFAGSSSQDWSNCSRHSGTETGSRTPTMNYDRPVADNPDAP